jgi:hypothetical protein
MNKMDALVEECKFVGELNGTKFDGEFITKGVFKYAIEKVIKDMTAGEINKERIHFNDFEDGLIAGAQAERKVQVGKAEEYGVTIL